jgi:histidyl-tRNA synthetase
MADDRFQPMKGTRDFYPDQMRLTRWVVDAWRRVSLRNGFEEYDAPLMESLELFTLKSGEEIVEQLYSLTDRGGRDLAIKPEITPSLARMVAAKLNSLPRPIKWFSVPRVCRAENPQRGRLREFYQWNVDIIGTDDVLADAECVFVAVDFLREVGLTADDVKVHVGSRRLVAAVLKAIGVDYPEHEGIFAVLDKRPKLSTEAFVEATGKVGLSLSQTRVIEVLNTCDDWQSLQNFARKLGGLAKADVQRDALGDALQAWHEQGSADASLEELVAQGGLTKSQAETAIEFVQREPDNDELFKLLNQKLVPNFDDALAEVMTLWNYLNDLRDKPGTAANAVLPWCRLDMRIVRGLAYYTGIVWEMFDAGESLRAVAAGGRYDNLLELVGGQPIGATGFGMGDVVLELLLKDKGKLPAELRERRLDVFVVDADEGRLGDVLSLVAELRRRGVSADFSYKRQSVGKQLKEANRRGARTAVLVGPDPATLAVKDLASGEQVDRQREQWLAEAAPLPGG